MRRKAKTKAKHSGGGGDIVSGVGGVGGDKRCTLSIPAIFFFLSGVLSIYLWCISISVSVLHMPKDGESSYNNAIGVNRKQAISSNKAARPQQQQQHRKDVDAVSTDAAAACMLVMDDNHFLIEWLAYHYHVLPLRRLILATDPRSKTSPHEILQRYKNDMDNVSISTDKRNNESSSTGSSTSTGIHIDVTEWTDADYFSSGSIERQEAEDLVKQKFGDTISDTLVQHRARQRVFYGKCLQQLKREGQTWVLLTDSDEFVHINYALVHKLQTQQQRQQQEQQEQQQSGNTNNIRVVDTSIVLPSPPSMRQAGSVLRFVETFRHRTDQNVTTSPCIQIPRLRYGAIESEADKIVAKVPSDYNASQFMTLRWRYRASVDNYRVNKVSKVLLDVSRVSLDDLGAVDSVHRPVKSLCSQRRMHIRASEQVLAIGHYLGTWEQYTFRDDSRKGDQRSREVYVKAGSIRQAQDDTVRPWLQGFVDSVGKESASRLLQGVGVVY